MHTDLKFRLTNNCDSCDIITYSVGIDNLFSNHGSARALLTLRRDVIDFRERNKKKTIELSEEQRAGRLLQKCPWITSTHAPKTKQTNDVWALIQFSLSPLWATRIVWLLNLIWIAFYDCWFYILHFGFAFGDNATMEWKMKLQYGTLLFTSEQTEPTDTARVIKREKGR